MTWPNNDRPALPQFDALSTTSDSSSFTDHLRRQAPHLLPAAGRVGALSDDLPHGTTSGPVVATVAVSITQNGDLFADARPVSEAELTTVMQQRHRENPDARAIIAADQRVSHGRVVHVIDLVRRAGVSKFAIQTQTEGGSAP